MIQQHPNGNAAAVWKARKVFVQLVVESQLSVVRQLQNAGSGELFRQRSNLEFGVYSIWGLPFPVGHAKGALVYNPSSLGDNDSTAEIIDLRLCLHEGVQ